MTLHILPFGAPPADLETVGGKGQSLAKMTKAGFPVPPGFTVTTSAYRQFVADNDLQQTIIELARPEIVGRTTSFDAASERIQGLFNKAELTDALKAEIGAAYAELGEKDPPVAVRSSANAEDLPELSFAGQQDTCLNMRGVSAVIAAVRRCWASLWTARAISYRHENGITQDAVAMAVVVQTMLASEVSGIVFTANPTTGERSEMIINASFGLGEAVVGGEVTPDMFIIDRETLELRKTMIGSKERMIVAVDGQGTKTRELAETERERLSLEEPMLRELAALALHVESHFGVPQDIEWAVADGSTLPGGGPSHAIFLLQSRPITNLPPAPLRDVKWEPEETGAQEKRDQVVEFMPGPLSPLFKDLYLRAVDLGFYMMRQHNDAQQYRQLAKVFGGEHPGHAVINGYAYRHFGLDGPRNPFIVRPPPSPAQRRSGRWTVRNISPGYYRNVHQWRHMELPKYIRWVELWRNVDPVTAESERLLAGIRSLSWADAHYWRYSAEVLGLPRRSDEALQLFLDHFVPEGGFTTGMLLDGSMTPTVQAPIELWHIARQIQSDQVLQDLVVSTPAYRLLQALESSDRGRPVVQAIIRYLCRYGHQIYSLDYVEPTPSQDPSRILSQLQTMALDHDYDPLAQRAQIRARRRAAVREVSRQLGFAVRLKFRWRLFWAQHYYPNRDSAQFHVGAGWPILQRLALELGRRLVAVGTFTRADDVYYLEAGELEQAIAASRENRALAEYKQFATERRELREARKRLAPPVMIPMEEQEQPSGSTADGEANVIKGAPVSPGKITAEVSVIRSPAEFDQMRPNSILVCPLTTPAWTQLFSHAVGLVTDVGSTTSHGSIVAREYGIPAVLGLSDITSRLSSGQVISIDGNAGTITIEEKTTIPVTPVASNTRPSLMADEVPAFIGLQAPLPFEYTTWQRRRAWLAYPFKAVFFHVLIYIYFKVTRPCGGPAAPQWPLHGYRP